MLGFLPLETSFAERKRHLGYRQVSPVDASFFDGPLMAHEFHYATILSEGDAARLFDTADAAGTPLGSAGLRRGRVAGSFMHLDRYGTFRMIAPIVHGGGITEAAAAFGGRPEDWLDLSTGSIPILCCCLRSR